MTGRVGFMRWGMPLLVSLFYLFLYLPIIVLVVFSFNSAELSTQWGGLSLHWYHKLFSSYEVWHVIQTSLLVAFSSVALSLTMGTLLILYGSRTLLGRYLLFFFVSLAVPEIVLAVGLLSIFMFLAVPLGIITLIAGHTLIGLGYVIPILYARFNELDQHITEASLDLGASHAQTMRRVILPLLSPALAAAGLLVFIISLDDFLLSFFCAGATVQTLPMYIFSLIRSDPSPMVHALSTLLLLLSSLIVLLVSSLKVKNATLMK